MIEKIKSWLPLASLLIWVLGCAAWVGMISTKVAADSLRIDSIYDSIHHIETNIDWIKNYLIQGNRP